MSVFMIHQRTKILPHVIAFYNLTLTTFTSAYVTYQDIRGIESFEDQTVIAIKAPPDTRLEVPDPTEVCIAMNQISLIKISDNHNIFDHIN